MCFNIAVDRTAAAVAEDIHLVEAGTVAAEGGILDLLEEDSLAAVADTHPVAVVDNLLAEALRPWPVAEEGLAGSFHGPLGRLHKLSSTMLYNNRLCILPGAGSDF